MLLKWTLLSPLKFKSPPQINMRNDQPVLGLAELREAWRQSRADLRELLEANEESLRHRLPYRHPYAGRMTLRQMLIFFNDHFAHHERQINRILRDLKA
jgi:uncharacterized damage-inducible protein DinB